MYIKRRHLVLVIGLVLLIDVIKCLNLQKKLNGKKQAKKIDEKTKSVSSDRVPNGGRKGPMSGSRSGQGLPMPIAMPFPLIPLRHKTKQKKKKKKQATEETNKSDSKQVMNDETNRKIKLPKTNHSKTHKKGDGRLNDHVLVNKTLIRSNIDIALTRLKRGVDNDLADQEETDDEIIAKIKKRLHPKVTTRKKRTLESSREQELSDEERQTAQDWLNEDSDDFIPGVDKVYVAPNELDFIWQGHSILSNAYNSLMPHLRMYKRSIDVETEEVDDDNLMILNNKASKEIDLDKRDIEENEEKEDIKANIMFLNAAAELDRKVNTREISSEKEDAEESKKEPHIVNEDSDFDDEEQNREARNAAIADEPPVSVEDAQRQVQNAEQAAAALTRLEIGIGIDPEHLISDTQKYVTSLQVEKARYDEDIRSHIEKAQEAEKRASFAVHDEISKKSQISKDVAAAKRQLDGDRRKIEEINTELKQLKDIELMATGLEVAKYMAKERAKHNLELAQSKATINRPLATMPSAQLSSSSFPAMTAPQQTVLASPLITAVPVTNQLLGASSVIPPYGSVQSETFAYQTPHVQLATPDFQMHQLGDQRHFESRPASYTPPLQLPLTQYFSNYIQTKNIMMDQFSAQPLPHGPSMVSPFSPHLASHSQFYPYKPTILEENHVGGDQRHTPARLPQQLTYMVKPLVSTVKASNYMTSFAKVPKPKTQNVGVDNHVTQFEQTHDHSDDGKDQRMEDNHDDNSAVLWFPGTTYSPPPSWNHNTLGPYSDRGQTGRAQYYPPPGQALNIPPHSSFKTYPAPVSLAEALTAISPIHQYAQQSSLAAAPVSAEYATALLAPPAHASAPVVPVPHSQPILQYIPPHTYQPSIFPETMVNMRPGAVPLAQPYAYAQQEAKAGQVISEFPPDEVVTINKKPPPPPPQPQPPDMSGTLPAWMGAVDSAKYDNDVSDRLRELTNDNNSDSSSSNVKREYLRLVHAEDQLNDIKKASNAVTHVEAAIGFDPGSIAKMVDFVKTAAKKDVTLSQETVDKDKIIVQKIQDNNSNNVKKSTIAKKSDIDNNSVALKHAKLKLQTDEAVLADAKDRLDKINKMEMIVTEIEVAKFYASMKAEKEVQGAKRTLEALKRNDVSKPH